MFTIKHILVPVDFTAVSQAALSAAIQLASQHNASVFVFHVKKNLDKALKRRIVTNPHESVIEKGIAADEEALMRAIELEYTRADNAGYDLSDIEIAIQVTGGDWLDVTLQLIADADVDMVVAGTHGPQGIKGRLMGSVVEQLAAKAPCSVLVVKPQGYPYLRD